ncbi:chitinase [Streptomyces violaceoruber]|uniref:Chitinase n=2 Tax=Streptomyces violaceoruber group TaxID=2867121 RepID=A0ABZ1LZY8_9ACTN|nr:MULTISPECIES: chitinase [Streptomyces]MDX3366353.1 chitinase [Streptomyces sp. ME02-6987-2C]MDX3407101.1 chitinase [Streptomyces sp. ME02-6977A]MDX3423431.1 chitinase [Streptomyces sp. ME02-6985-2c]THA95641.1 hydrolase [Streptomyces sp. LRa12]
MRVHRTATAGCALLFALVTAGCAGQDDGTADAAPASPSAPSEPTTAYAPYVSATTASATDTAGSPTTYNLAFAISSGDDCVPRWNGVQDIDDASVASRVEKLRESGATVRVSFGGASGTELAAACGSASALAAAYGTALDAAGSTRADFDIEGDALTDAGSVALRSEAIALLQEQRDGLEVSFTLPVMPTGLDTDGLALLASANDHGVQVSAVNLMTMNYGESYTADMGDYALASAKAAHTQLKKVFGTSEADAWRGMALTSMLGVNDVAGETFTLADAAEVRAFAEEKGIAWVSMWAAFRDRQCAEDASATDALTTCSGVAQEEGAFGTAFGA